MMMIQSNSILTVEPSSRLFWFLWLLDVVLFFHTQDPSYL